jgi:hypothetical protein
MSRLSSRLARVEGRLSPLGTEPRGAYEIHYLNAWPDCKGTGGIQRCEEHAPTCGVMASPTRAPGRQVLILRGGPWPGLD